MQEFILAEVEVIVFDADDIVAESDDRTPEICNAQNLNTNF